MNKKKCLKKIIFIMVLFILIMSTGLIAKTNDISEIATNKYLTIEEKVDRLLISMSLTEKVGQLVMVGIQGTELNADSVYVLNQFHYGGIVFFDRNMESKEQVKKLAADLQAKAGGKIPLFIAVDEEGGEVARMKDKLEPPPSQLEIGNSGESQNAKTWAQKTARELKNMGINVNFAPVADIGSIGTRHYSDNAKVVEEFVAKAADGYESEKEIYALKHFPGIGKGKTDTHIDSVIVDEGQSVIMSEDVLPFKYIIDTKESDSYFIMVSHVTYPQIDSERPASISKIIVTDMLRDNLGYKGIIITDDIEMGAISNYYSFRELGVKAINAGADIVMVCHEYNHEEAVYMGILEAVKNGEITEDRLNESVKRIIRAKLSQLL